MTTFDALESSRESSRPVELYEILVGGSAEYRFTDGEDEITIGSDVYTPESVARGRIEIGSDQRNRTLSVVVPVGIPLAQRFIGIPPAEKTVVNVYRLQRGEVPTFNTQVRLFRGVLQGVTYDDDGHSAVLNLKSRESALNGTIPRFTFMSSCNHVLYSPGCGADASSHSILSTVTAASGLTVTIAGLGASGRNFRSGYITPTGFLDPRLVVAQSGDVVTLLVPYTSDPTGLDIQAFAGCDHKVDGDCALVFDRVADFGGFPFVPNKNIFETGLD